MNEFAHVLSEIVERGKHYKIKIKDIANHAGIAASYVSNLKQGNQGPPAHKTLLKITAALRHFDVPETDIQRLLDAYNRTQLGLQEDLGLLESLGR